MNTLESCLNVALSLFPHPQSLVNVGDDCPVFDGLFEFCQLSAGGSIGFVVSHSLSLMVLS
jgi:hypothetical protein